MSDKALAKSYDSLTPEERFRLILAAGARGDKEEQNRLISAGRRIMLSLPDHTPYALAFNELALQVFIELLDEATRYLEAFDQIDDTCAIPDNDDEVEHSAETEDSEHDAAKTQAEAEPAEGDYGKKPIWERFLDLALACGFLLRTKADGWKLFCERLTIPPFVLWEIHPGYDRLQRALALAEKAAFVPEGRVCWLKLSTRTSIAAGSPISSATPTSFLGMKVG
jgi:hypothetical protein